MTARPLLVSLAALMLPLGNLMCAADSPAAAKPTPAPAFTFTPEQRAEMQRNQARAEQDWAALMAQLHLAVPTLPPADTDPYRPAGTSRVPGNPYNWTDGVPGHTIVRSPWGHWTNYDLARASTGRLPDPLVHADGTPVRDAANWWHRRRPELLELFARDIYGRIPSQTPAIRWETSPASEVLDGLATRRHVIGHIDNSAYPEATPTIELTLDLPRSATKPVPVIVALTFVFGGREFGGDTARREVLAHGWGYASFNPTLLQPDTGGGLDRGIIGLVNRGQPRTPEQWGAIAAWSWGLSRIIDYLQTQPGVDAHRLGVQGHSRYGKTALVAAALDPRWAIVFASCSGEGGAKLHRHDVGENVDNVCGSGEYHWMAGNFLRYAGHWNDLPVDQHELIALVAPRPAFITGGTEDLWSDPVGEFAACIAAGPVYRLLGARDLGTTEMPAPDHALLEGELAFREHAGGHTDLPDWPVFLTFADHTFTP